MYMVYVHGLLGRCDLKLLHTSHCNATLNRVAFMVMFSSPESLPISVYQRPAGPAFSKDRKSENEFQ